MTLSFLARDSASGSFGIVIASSSPAVASRCVSLAAGTGAVASQNVTNPALGAAILSALSSGSDARSALAAGLDGERHPDFRQVAVIDASGRTAIHSGARALGISTHASGPASVAAGNMLAAYDVPQRMIDAYLSNPAVTLEERLLAALRGGLSAGGEAGPVRSAGLAVVDRAPWRTTDLRVDDHDDPFGELDRLLKIWLPQKLDYLTRAESPEAAPSFGVPGDE